MDHQRDRRSGGHPPLVRKRSRLRPPRVLRATRPGWCFIAIIFGVGFAALNTGNNLLYLVLALMLAFLVLSGILSETSLRGLRIERVLPRELFALSPNRIVLRVHNSQRRNACFAITIEDRLESDAGLDPAGRVFALRVGPRSSTNLSYLFEPERRGDVRFAGFRVSTRFPFGLFIKSRDLDLVESAIVYPPVQRLSIDARTDPASSEQETCSGNSADGDEIAGLREFVRGDSHARVHWRSSIRVGRLLVGEREGLADTEFEVRLRLPASASDKLVEERVARAASEVVTHLETGSRVGLQSKAIRFNPATGFAHRSALLTFLARVTPDAIDPSDAAQKTANGVSR
jgi:uncharacterized protein (DUF58 family)